MAKSRGTDPIDRVADAIDRNFTSPNVADSNLESANVVDVLSTVAYRLSQIAGAVCVNAAPGKDETGGSVGCLTEAVMGVTAGLCKIAEGLHDVAQAIREQGEDS